MGNSNLSLYKSKHHVLFFKKVAIFRHTFNSFIRSILEWNLDNDDCC